MWQMKHGDKSSHGRKLCDVHMAAQEREKNIRRDSNQAMMTQSRDGISATQPVLNDNVKICCPRCNEEKEIYMNIFWKKDTPNCFSEQIVSLCHVGKHVYVLGNGCDALAMCLLLLRSG